MTSALLRLPRVSAALAIAMLVAAPALGEPATIKLGDIKGESTDDKHKGEIEVLSWSWGEARQGKNIRKQVSVASSDPEEGGEIAPGVSSSDPEEGGEVVREPGTLETPNLKPTRPTVSDITIGKEMDKSTPTLSSADPEEGGETAAKMPGLQKSADVTLKRGDIGSGGPVTPAVPKAKVESPRDAATGQATGKRRHQPLAMEKGSLFVTLPEGACMLGARYPTVTLRADDRAYQLSDVTVADCSPVATAKGKKDKAKLDYMIVKMETILVTG